MTLIVHPFTADANNKPAYTAESFRRTNTVWLSPADTSIGSASSCIQGVRNESGTPICSISGLTVTVKAHSGIIYPFDGQSPYTYYISDESVSIPNVTQSWKIAIVVTDPGVGIGDKPGATLKAISSTTPDRNINGIVLALVTQGVVNDIVPRLLSGSIIQVKTLDALQQIHTTEGQRAHVTDNDGDYVFKNNNWYCTYRVALVPAFVTPWWNSSDLKLVKNGETVTWSVTLKRIQSTWAGDPQNTTFTPNGVPTDMRPSRIVWGALDNRFGIFFAFDANGSILFGRDRTINYATMGIGASIDLMGSYMLNMGNLHS